MIEPKRKYRIKVLDSQQLPMIIFEPEKIAHTTNFVALVTQEREWEWANAMGGKRIIIVMLSVIIIPEIRNYTLLMDSFVCIQVLCSRFFVRANVVTNEWRTFLRKSITSGSRWQFGMSYRVCYPATVQCQYEMVVNEYIKCYAARLLQHIAHTAVHRHWRHGQRATYTVRT